MIPAGAVWVRMPRFIGDGLMISQALAPLRAAGLPLVAFGPAPLMDLFDGSGAFAACVADAGKPGSWALAGLLRRHRAAAVVNLPRSTRALAAGFLARTQVRVGWREGGGALLGTATIPFKDHDDHQLDRYAELLAKAFPGLTPAADTPFRPRAEALAEAERLRGELGLQGPFVILGMGSASWVKRLETIVWRPIIEHLRARQVPHVLVGGTFFEDLEQAKELKEAFPGIPDLVGQVPLPVTAGLVAQAAALVGNDSALSHLAAACHTPLVAAFGPTRPEWTAPRGGEVVILRQEGLDCLGCLTLQCPVAGHPCMTALDPVRFTAELDRILAKA